VKPYFVRRLAGGPIASLLRPTGPVTTALALPAGGKNAFDAVRRIPGGRCFGHEMRLSGGRRLGVFSIFDGGGTAEKDATGSRSVKCVTRTVSAVAYLLPPLWFPCHAPPASVLIPGAIPAVAVDRQVLVFLQTRELAMQDRRGVGEIQM